MKENKKLILAPIIIALGFIPLIVHYFKYDPRLNSFDWFPNVTNHIDYFLAYKSFAIIIVACSMILILFHKYKTKHSLSFIPIFYVLFAYVLLAFMSSLVSPYRSYAFRGNFELFESFFVILSYAIFCYFAFQCTQTEKDIENILYLSSIGFVLVSLIGVCQYFGYNFFNTEIGKRLITNPDHWDTLEKLRIDDAVCSTLYNVDYLSFYFGLLIPVSIALFFSSRRLWGKIFYTILTLAFFICIIGSGASSGLLALGLSATFALFLRISKRSMLFAGILAGCTIISGIVYLSFSTTDLGTKISNAIWGTAYYEDYYPIQNIETTEENILFEINNNKMLVSYNVDFTSGEFQLNVTDEEFHPFDYTVTNEPTTSFYVEDYTFGTCQITPTKIDNTFFGIEISIGGRLLYFVKTEDGYRYLNRAQKLVKVTDVPLSRMVYDDFLGGRGRIIRRILPILPKYSILGIGTNNFLFAFPQVEDLAYINGYGFDYDVKAHNWYLQQWVENGLLALICLLVFIGWYVIQSIKIYHKVSLDDGISRIGFGVFVGILTYLIVAIANDSNVNTAPVFWILLGIGYSTNVKIKKQLKD